MNVLQRLLFVSLVSSLLCCAVGCDLKVKGQPSLQADAAAPSATPTPELVAEERFLLAVGLPTYRQSFENLVALTGISPTAIIPASGGLRLSTTYDLQRSVLPASGLAAEATTPVFFTTAVLAANACAVFVGNEATTPVPNRRAFSSVNFASTATSAQFRGTTGDTLVAGVGESLFQLFHARLMTADEAAAVLTARNEILTGAADSTALRNGFLTLICGAIASSIGALAL